MNEETTPAQRSMSMADVAVTSSVIARLKNRRQTQRYAQQAEEQEKKIKEEEERAEQERQLKEEAARERLRSFMQSQKTEDQSTRAGTFHEFSKRVDNSDPLSNPDTFKQASEPLISAAQDDEAYARQLQEQEFNESREQNEQFMQEQVRQQQAMLEHYNNTQVMSSVEGAQPRQAPVPSGADDENGVDVRAAMPQRELNLMEDEGAGIYQQQPVNPDAPKPWGKYRENDWMIAFTLALGAFILYGTLNYASLDTVKLKDLQMSPEEAEKYTPLFRTAETAKLPDNCNLDTTRIMNNYLLWILAPALAYRLYIKMKYHTAEDSEELDFNESYLYVRFMWNGLYGVWTLYNLQRFVALPAPCKRAGNASLFNFEVTLILGTWSAAQCLFISLLIIICVPILIYYQWKAYRARTAHIRRVDTLKKNLVQKPYNATTFPEPESCLICMYDFQVDDQVTPLPCSKVHLYHTECIKSWFSKMEKNEEICPMCRAIVTTEQCKELNKNFDQVFCPESQAHEGGSAIKLHPEDIEAL